MTEYDPFLQEMQNFQYTHSTSCFCRVCVCVCAQYSIDDTFLSFKSSLQGLARQ